MSGLIQSCTACFCSALWQPWFDPGENQGRAECSVTIPLSKLPPKRTVTSLPFPAGFPLSSGGGTQLNPTRCGWASSAPSPAQPSLPRPCAVCDRQAQLCSPRPRALQTVAKMTKKISPSSEERRSWWKLWLSAKSLHSGFSFLVSALCWKVSTYALVSMATAFLAFLL